MSTDPSRGYGRAGQNSFDDLRPILERRTANPVSSQSRLATARELQNQMGWLCSPAHRCRPYFRILLDEQPRPSGCSTTSLQNGEFTWLPVICSDRFGSKTSRIDLTSCVFAAEPDAPAPRLGLPEHAQRVMRVSLLLATDLHRVAGPVSARWCPMAR
jgi:hypothetical protein